MPRSSVAAKVTVEVRRAAGLTARRGELDGFAGAMTRLRGAYDAMQQTWPVAGPPDALVDAMQTGDRLSYYPERIAAELAHLHDALAQAQADVAALDKDFEQRLERCLAAYRRLRRRSRRHREREAEAPRRPPPRRGAFGRGRKVAAPLGARLGRAYDERAASSRSPFSFLLGLPLPVAIKFRKLPFT